MKYTFLVVFQIMALMDEQFTEAESYMSSYFILIEHVVFFSPLWEKRLMVSMYLVLLLIKGKYFAKG